MICIACGFDNNEDSQSCARCGLPLRADADARELSDDGPVGQDEVIGEAVEADQTHADEASETEQADASEDPSETRDDEVPGAFDNEEGIAEEGSDDDSDDVPIDGLSDESVEDDGEDDSTDEEEDDDEWDDIPIRGKHARIPGVVARKPAVPDESVSPSPESDSNEENPTEFPPYPSDFAESPAEDDQYGYWQVDEGKEGEFEGDDAASAANPLVSQDDDPAAVAESLRDLPELDDQSIPGTTSYTETTAVMPPIEVSKPVRYSTGDRDRADAHRKRMPGIPMVIAALCAVVAILGIAYFLSSAGPRGVEVPDVVGMSSASARSELLDAGFRVNVESQLTEDNFGIVLYCDPPAGSKRKAGSRVTITVSASRTIPDVVGMDVEAAKDRLADEGAQLVMVVSKASNQPENTVIGIEPEAGTAFNPQDEVTLTVASSAQVPDVTGQNEADAQATLEEAGYKVEIRWADSDLDAGLVVSTSPEAGANANLNSTVVVYVASPGPRDIYHLIDFFNAPSEGNSQYLQWKGYTIAGGYTYEDTVGGAEESEEGSSDEGEEGAGEAEGEGAGEGEENAEAPENTGEAVTFASQAWQTGDGSTINFTGVPFTNDVGASGEDYLAEGYSYQGVRLYIPQSSALSMTTDISIDTVQAYMSACGFDNIEDTCSVDDIEYNGATGAELGLPPFICSQGRTDGYVWTVLVTEDATYIGCGTEECYDEMDSICDEVVINEMYSS